MKKRAIVLVLFLAVMVIGLTVFIFNNFNNGTNTKKDDFVFTKPLKESTITFYFPGTEPKGMNEVLDKIQKETNIKLVCKFIKDEAIHNTHYYDRIQDILDSNVPCDAFYFADELYPSDYKMEEWKSNGTLLDISEVLPKCAPNYYKKLKPEDIKASKIGNILLGVPNRYPQSKRQYAIVREDLMKKYNISDIKNYSDFEVYLKTIKEKEPKIAPLVINDGDLEIFTSTLNLFAEANGYVAINKNVEFNRNIDLVYKWDDPDMKLVPWEQTQEYKKSLDIITNWHNNGYIGYGVYSIESQQIGSIIGLKGTEDSFNKVLMSNGIDWRYKSYPLYTDKVSEKVPPINYSLVLNAKTKNAESVLQFLEWLQSSQKNYDLFMYGFKGKQYTLDGESLVAPEGTNIVDAYFNWTGRMCFRNVEYERPVKSLSDVNETPKSENDNSKYPLHSGFYIDFKAANFDYNARIQAIRESSGLYFSTPFETQYIENFINEQKDFGIDKIVSDVQMQLNKWRSDNQK